MKTNFKKNVMAASAVLLLISTTAMSQSTGTTGFWDLKGNSGTNSGTNFIGTIDNVNFKIRTKNKARIIITAAGKVAIGSVNPVFKLDVEGGSINTDSVYRINGNTYVANPGTGNLAVGVGALKLNSNRFNLVAVGDSALYNNSVGAQSGFEGNYNTAVGSKALKANTTGAWNTALGYHTLYKNTFGTENTAVGSEALENAVFGTGNTAFGHQTLQNTTGFYNTAVGKDALNLNTTGSDNIAIGKEALLHNTDRSGNVAIGTGALYNNGISTAFSYEASANVAMGFEASNANTTGFDNTALGYHSQYANTTGFHNTSIGSFALASNNIGFYNTALGDGTLSGITSGERNTGLGHSAGVSIVTGTYNTCVGAYTNMNDGLTNSTVIGNNAFITISNAIAVGNTSVGSIKGQVAFTTFSDARIKKNIQENVPGLKFINELKPVTYNYDIHKQNELLGVKDNGDWAGKYDIEKTTFTGFLAQEVDEAAKKIEYDFSGVDKSEKLLGLRYSEFVVPLVKAVQELDAKTKEIEILKNEIEAIKSVLSPEQKSKLSNIHVSETVAVLFQNNPNPFSEKTTISYTIPANSSNAVLKIYSLEGAELNSIAIATKGSGQSEIKAGTLAAGTYTYMLVVDGKTLDTKQMVLTK
ncbi:MAG: tail fiber domain-containing protein [Bacteroidia bacterium]